MRNDIIMLIIVKLKTLIIKKKNIETPVRFLYLCHELQKQYKDTVVCFDRKWKRETESLGI